MEVGCHADAKPVLEQRAEQQPRGVGEAGAIVGVGGLEVVRAVVLGVVTGVVSRLVEVHDATAQPVEAIVDAHAREPEQASLEPRRLGRGAKGPAVVGEVQHGLVEAAKLHEVEREYEPRPGDPRARSRHEQCQRRREHGHEQPRAQSDPIGVLSVAQARGEPPRDGGRVHERANIGQARARGSIGQLKHGCAVDRQADQRADDLRHPHEAARIGEARGQGEQCERSEEQARRGQTLGAGRGDPRP